MNIKSLFLSNSSQLLEGSKEVSNSFFNTSLNTNCGLYVKVGGQKDALEAVKLDPAVLEAQVTVHDNPKDNGTRSQNHVIESNKDKEAQPTKIEWTTAAKSKKGFDKMVSQSEAALLSLTPHQLELLMKYADMLRRQRIITQRYLECAFCKNNGRPSSWYTSHVLKDERGRVQCPVLRRYRCPRCGATGIYAHTIKYCPEDSQIDTLSCRSSNLF